MNVDAIVLALVAVADFALIVHLRRRHNRRVRVARMTGSLRFAVWRANSENAIPGNRQLRRAS